MAKAPQPFWKQRHAQVEIRVFIPYKQWKVLDGVRAEFNVPIGEQVRVLIAHGLRKPVRKL